MAPGLWTGQFLHFISLAVLLAGSTAAWQWIGRPAPLAFWASIAVPVLHEVYVWLTWRLELRTQAVSRSIGFTAYLGVFFVLLAARPVAILALAWLDRRTLGLDPAVRWTATGALFLPFAYTMYSVVRYFGLVRAAGADHFVAAYRSMPLERRGIFRFTLNGMYAFGFLGFWAIATGFDSRAALIAAAFSHAYIWVHFFATERPDLRHLYGQSA